MHKQLSGYRKRFLVLIKLFFFPVSSQIFYQHFFILLSGLNVVNMYFYFPFLYISLEARVVSKQLPNLDFPYKDVVILNTGTPQASFQFPLC